MFLNIIPIFFDPNRFSRFDSKLSKINFCPDFHSKQAIYRPDFRPILPIFCPDFRLLLPVSGKYRGRFLRVLLFFTNFVGIFELFDI